MKILLGIFTMLLFVSGCANVQAGEGTFDIIFHHHGSFNRIDVESRNRTYIPSDLEELMYDVPNIVRGRIGNDPTIVYQYNGDFRFPTHNKVSLEIIEVMRGDLQVGETIHILEPYRIEDGVLFSATNYMPSLPYHEYFFFLGYQLTEIRPSGNLRPDSFIGAYFVWNGEFGRFRVPDSTMMRTHGEAAFNEAELSLGRRADTDLYMKLWQQVVDAYMDWGRLPHISQRFEVREVNWYEMD